MKIRIEVVIIKDKWYQREIHDICRILSTDERGLSSKEAEKRLLKNGKNILPKKKKDSLLKLFFSEFKDPILLLLFVAILASLFVGEVFDALVIFFIIMIDAIVGTYEENKANRTMDSLSKLVSYTATVLRDNKEISIASEDLVLGDVVLLESGERVSADLRIIESTNLMVDESILTGESIQVEKNDRALNKSHLSLAEQSNMLFSGTTIVKGRCLALVVGVSSHTEIGHIADTIHHTEEEKSPLTLRIEKLSRQISFLVLIIAIMITFLLLYKNVDHSEIFLSVVALSVSAMPEGLPLALTMALSIASTRMARKNVVVKKLNSAEALGSCTVIATDKTGTLTVNEQMAKKILLPDGSSYLVSGTGYDRVGTLTCENESSTQIEKVQDLALFGSINNEATVTSRKVMGDSIDIAFKILGKKLEVEERDIKILSRIPYESENRYSATFFERDGKAYCTIKGSFEKVCAFCTKTDLVKNHDTKLLEKQNELLAKEGYRVLTIACGRVANKKSYTEKDIKNLTFMGMVAFIDPIRKDAIKSIQECRSAGIRVMMITGDHPLTAFAIAKELDITVDYSLVATSDDVRKAFAKGEKSFDSFVQTKCVFSRVSPLEKLEIVNSLKRSGEFVAVTGDGVNDAPALKSANIGVSMGSGTDISKDVADMVIIDDNFKSIVNGIKEGRVAYANIRKIIFFLLSCGLAEVLFFCLSILFNLELPLVAIQLLWLNVVTDGIQDFALSFEKAEKDIMHEQVRDTDENLFDRNLMEEVFVSGLIIGVLVFLVWYYLICIVKLDILVARSYIMALMVFIQNIHVFNCRSEKKSAFQISFKSNMFIVFGVGASILLQIIMMEIEPLAHILKITPIPFFHLLHLFILSLTILLLMEAYKKIKYKNI